MTPRGKKLLKIASACAMLMGIVCVFVGFYVMASGMSLDEAPTEEQMKTLRLVSGGGMYVMVNGIINVVAGFIGFINAGELEYAVKCRNYAYALIALAIINVVALVILAMTWKMFTIIVAVVPALIAGAYYAGAALNVADEKLQQK